MKSAIKRIMDDITDDLVITSAGTISREVFACYDRPQNLYLMGSMGCALGVGIGLALNTKRTVAVIAGDGDILMSMGTLVLMNALRLPNLKLYVIDNNSYAATGGQATCSHVVEFPMIADCVVFKVKSEKTDTPRITLSPIEICKRFYDTINTK